MNKFVQVLLIALILMLSIGCSSNQKIETTTIIEGNNTEAISNNLVDQENSEPHFFMDFKLDQDVANEQEDSAYPYFKLTSSYKDKLSGKFYIENTQLDTNIILVAMQGRKTTLLRESGATNWSRSLKVESNKNSIIDIQLDIEWDQDESDELIIFPYVESFDEFYSGAHSSLIRLFVGDNRNYKYTNEDLQKKEFQISDELKLFPELSWIDENNQEINKEIRNNKLIAEKQYYKLLMSPLSSDTTVDIVYFNTLGESEVLYSGYIQRKDKDSIITIDKKKMETYHNKNTDQFLLVVNNKDDEMLLDILAVNEGINSMSSSFQKIIKILPVK